MAYRLLETFDATFQGKRYLHRKATLGDFIAMQLYEDLYAIGKSARFRKLVDRQERVLNVQNQRRGVEARRGDGTFGELIPNAKAIQDRGYAIARGPVATVEVGVEVKILAKAMLKQIDRVIGDLIKQVAHFRRGAGVPICVGVVGINNAPVYTSYERDRVWKTDGKEYKHPMQEAAAAEARLLMQAKPSFDEFLTIRYRTTNVEPYRFEWVDLQATELDYGAILTRISREYDRRFRNANGEPFR